MEPKDLEIVGLDGNKQTLEEALDTIGRLFIPAITASLITMAIKKISPPQIWKIYVPNETGIWEPVDGSWKTEAEARKFYCQNIDKFRSANGTVKMPMYILEEAE